MTDAEDRVRCWAAGIRLVDRLETFRNDLIARQKGNVMPGTDTPMWHSATYASVRAAFDAAIACGVPGVYRTPDQVAALERFPETPEEMREEEIIAGQLRILAQDFADKMATRPPAGSRGAVEKPETLTGRLRTFTDACGDSSWRGYDIGGDWNGWANVVVPEAEAERMIKEWRDSVGNDPAQVMESGYDEASLPPVTTAILNGKETRVRDFSYGYAFSWTDEGKRARRCARKGG